MTRSSRRTLVLGAVTPLMVWLCAAPPLGRFGSILWGDAGDGLQTLWNAWWMRTALADGRNPFYTTWLFFPDGVSLWLQTFGPLNALVSAGVAGIASWYAAFNVPPLLHVSLTFFFGAMLAHELVQRAHAAGRLAIGAPEPILSLAAVVGGAAATFTPYLWAHLPSHLHCISLGFVPVFALALVRSEDGITAGRVLTAAGAVVATALCGWYVLLDAALVGSAIVLAAIASGKYRRARDVTVVYAVALLAVAPLALRAAIAQTQDLEGLHDPAIFSADLQALWIPNPAMHLGRHFDAITQRWTGWWENGGYLGIAAVLLTIVGVMRARDARLNALVAVGLVGVVLSLGPYLHVGGRFDPERRLPYYHLARLVPLIDRLGCPVRFGAVMNLALGMGVAAGIAAIGAALARRHAARAFAVCLMLGGAVLAEYRYRDPIATELHAPPWLSQLDEGTGDAAVLDLTGWSAPLYHQTLHGLPMLGGYVSRQPAPLVRALTEDPVVGPLLDASLRGRTGTHQVVVDRIDESLEHDWTAGPPAPGINIDFAVTWSGVLVVPVAATYELAVGSDDAASLAIGGRTVVEAPGRHPSGEQAGTVTLDAGEHPIEIHLGGTGDPRRSSVRWRRLPDGALAPLGRESLRTETGAPGLTARYASRVLPVRLQGLAAQDHLRRRWSLRWIIAPAGRYDTTLHTTLALTERRRGGGLVLFEVP